MTIGFGRISPPVIADGKGNSEEVRFGIASLSMNAEDVAYGVWKVQSCKDRNECIDSFNRLSVDRDVLAVVAGYVYSGGTIVSTMHKLPRSVMRLNAGDLGCEVWGWQNASYDLYSACWGEPTIELTPAAVVADSELHRAADDGNPHAADQVESEGQAFREGFASPLPDAYGPHDQQLAALYLGHARDFTGYGRTTAGIADPPFSEAERDEAMSFISEERASVDGDRAAGQDVPAPPAAVRCAVLCDGPEEVREVEAAVNYLGSLPARMIVQAARYIRGVVSAQHLTRDRCNKPGSPACRADPLPRTAV